MPACSETALGPPIHETGLKGNWTKRSACMLYPVLANALYRPHTWSIMASRHSSVACQRGASRQLPSGSTARMTRVMPNSKLPGARWDRSG